MEYLGTIPFSYGVLEIEVKNQVEKTEKVEEILNNTIWRNKHISTEIKCRIYKATVASLITYTAEIRPDATNTQRLLKTAGLRILRIIGRKLRNRIRSEENERKRSIEKL